MYKVNPICTMVTCNLTQFARGDKIICISDFKCCHTVEEYVSECDLIWVSRMLCYRDMEMHYKAFSIAQHQRIGT